MNLKCLLLPERVKIALYCFFAVAVGLIMRACLSVAITEIVEPTEKNSGSYCNRTKTVSTFGFMRYEWTQAEQGFVLSSFYIGYVLTHLPSGLLAERFGGKWTLSLGILESAVFSFLTPLAVHHGGYVVLIIVRIFLGLGLGTTFPAVTVLIAAWVPEKERSEIGSLVFGGVQIGVCSGYFLTGLILKYLSWEWVFYIWGIVELIWFGLFTYFCYNDPASDPSLSNKERSYLESQIGHLKRDKELPSTPWKDILTNFPVMALLSAQIGHDWCSSIMITYLPKYMREVLGFEIFDVGIFSSIPYLVMWIVSLSSGFLSDYLISHGILSITFVRKLFTCGAIFTGIFLIVASYAGCDRVAAVAWFIVAIGFMGVYYSHIKVNSIDLSPNYAGILSAFSNGIGALTGIISPLFAGLLTPTNSLEEWQTVFWVTFGIYIVTTLGFCIGASGDIQLWNYPKEWKEPKTDVEQRADEKNENQST